MKNLRNTDSGNAFHPSKIRAYRVVLGPKPVWGELEVQLADWIKDMHHKLMAVTRVLVFHKALEFQPNFMGGLLESKFMKQAMDWYFSD